MDFRWTRGNSISQLCRVPGADLSAADITVSIGAFEKKCVPDVLHLDGFRINLTPEESRRLLVGDVGYKVVGPDFMFTGKIYGAGGYNLD